MRVARLRFAFPVIIALTAGCTSADSVKTANSSDVAARASVDSVSGRLFAALRSDNADSLMALTADDIAIMPPNEAVLRGKPAVRAWYDAFVKQMHTSSLTTSNREVFVSQDYATEIAQFEWTLKSVEGGPAVVDRGSYMQVWHRQADGKWMFFREVWNSMAPSGK
jgi:ketosteroid isomerase-like protein